MIFTNLEIKKIISSPWFIFVVASLIGGVFFIFFYGISCVNPLNTNWLMYGGDIKQHFMGWQFFRSADWSFPFGVVSSLAYPFGLPITYMDSIPLLAIPLKLFNAILPTNFQYFGLWGLFCYMAQGGLAALIIRHWTKDKIIILLCTAFFILSPVMMIRMFAHTSLASQWIILVAILATIEWHRIKNLKKQILVWSTLLIVGLLIHPYFIPMVGMFFVISTILTHKTWVKTILKSFIVTVSSGVIFWLIGGFQIKQIANDGLGDYAFNLDSLFNPIGWSSFLHTIMNASSSNETMNYLGLGLLLMLPIVIYLAIIKFQNKKYLKVQLKRLNIRYILIAVVVLGMLILAVSPRIQYGTLILIDIKLPTIIEKIWSVFRASARLFWPIYYLIIVGILAFIIRTSKRVNRKFIIIFLIIFVSIQFVDVYFSEGSEIKRSVLHSHQTERYKSSLNLRLWSNLSKGCTHMVYLDGMGGEDFFKLVDVALPNNLTMNTGYYARKPGKLIQDYQDEQRKLLSIGKAETSLNLFITKDELLIGKLKSNHNYAIEHIDGYYIIKQYNINKI